MEWQICSFVDAIFMDCRIIALTYTVGQNFKAKIFVGIPKSTKPFILENFRLLGRVHCSGVISDAGFFCRFL